MSQNQVLDVEGSAIGRLRELVDFGYEGDIGPWETRKRPSMDSAVPEVVSLAPLPSTAPKPVEQSGEPEHEIDPDP